VEPSDWITVQEWSATGSSGAAGLGQTPVLRVKVGDVITVQGSAKSGDSRGVVRLERVKRLDYSYRALNLAWWTRYNAARESVPLSLPPDVDRPVVEGVEWQRIGSPDGTTIRFDSKVTDNVALLACVEGVPLEAAQRPR
jgi:hypothetical protein